MKVVFVTDGISTPASRFRCAQFFSHFEAHGIECTLRYAYGDHYNQAINRFYGGPYKFACRARRAWHQLNPPSDTDILFLQRTAFPFTGVIEELGRDQETPTIFDFDDSLFVDALGNESPSRRRAFNDALDAVDYLIPGNRFLDKESGSRTNSQVIPTVIDTHIYTPRKHQTLNTKTVLGWMGTAGNFPFLASIVPEIKTLLSHHPNTIMRIVANQTFQPLVGVDRVQQIPWSADTELDWLQSFDIGLMPLLDSPLTRGKCAFKMIQYMATGIPVVVSPVGANVEVFTSEDPIGVMPRHGEWLEALEFLVSNPELRRHYGSAGRARAVERFSIDAVLPLYLGIFERLA